MTVASPRLAPTGGTQPLFGNNPLALAVPGDQAFPLLIDWIWANGSRQVGVGSNQGRIYSKRTARDCDGNDTTDPRVGLKGSIIPIAGAQGLRTHDVH